MTNYTFLFAKDPVAFHSKFALPYILHLENKLPGFLSPGVAEDFYSHIKKPIKYNLELDKKYERSIAHIASHLSINKTPFALIKSSGDLDEILLIQTDECLNQFGAIPRPKKSSIKENPEHKKESMSAGWDI